MKNNRSVVTCEQVRETDMVAYLSTIGYEPTKIRRNDHWYLSPFRDEKTASFKINRAINRWYDHGIGKGGDLVDFLSILHNCTIQHVLKTFENKFILQRPLSSKLSSLPLNNKLKVQEVFPIASFGLHQYIKGRGIPYPIVVNYCNEIRYEINGRNYYGIGFKNDEGGYEIRSRYFKNGSSPKGITSIKNNQFNCAVFEGFFDFLSFLFLFQNNEQTDWSFCILNSLSFFEKSQAFLKQFTSIHLYLDNDTAGQNCSRNAVSSDKRFIDESHLYEGYKDLNEWLVSMGRNKSKSKRIDSS